MDTYSMSQVEVLSGITAHKLRIWERRYEFVKPKRTETNIRLYSDQQLKKLINVGILDRNGFRISKIVKMSDDEIHENVTNILSNITSEYEDEINALIIHMMEYDERAFQSVFQKSIIRRGFLSTIVEVIYPLLNQIGILWGTSKIITSQEHFISNLIRQKVISAIDALPLPAENAPIIALFLLDNEDHEIGLLLSSFIAKNLGWKVLYLGQRVPSEDTRSFVKKTNPDTILTMFTTSKNNSEIEKIQELFNSIPNTQILVSGSPFSKKIITDCSNCTHIDSPNELIENLQKHN